MSKNETSYLRIRLKNAEKTGFEQSNFEQMIMTRLCNKMRKKIVLCIKKEY